MKVTCPPQLTSFSSSTLLPLVEAVLWAESVECGASCLACACLEGARGGGPSEVSARMGTFHFSFCTMPSYQSRSRRSELIMGSAHVLVVHLMLELRCILMVLRPSKLALQRSSCVRYSFRKHVSCARGSSRPHVTILIAGQLLTFQWHDLQSGLLHFKAQVCTQAVPLSAQGGHRKLTGQWQSPRGCTHADQIFPSLQPGPCLACARAL